MHEVHLLADVVVIFSVGILAAWMLRTLGAPSIIGYLTAGVIIGPSGLRLIAAEDIGALSEFGLVLLLFVIGLELSPEPLLRMGKSLMIASSVQIGVTAALVCGAAVFFPDIDLRAGVILGIIVALSSTAIVLKQISDRGEANTVTGRMTTGILLVQDVLVIAVMLLLPFFALGGGEGDWLERIAPSAIGIMGLIGIVLFGRRALTVFLRKVILPGGSEFVTLFAVMAAFGGAWLAGLVGWSLPLGACIAGLLLAEADARHQIASDILPFRDVFNALFFISMGMLVDVQVALEHAVFLTVAVAATLVLKSVVTAIAVGVAGWPARASLQIGFGLCTVSEFGYVLAREANRMSMMPEEILSLVTVYVVGTMFFGAMLVPLASPLAQRVAGILQPDRDHTGTEQADMSGVANHIIVCGFGTNGQNLAKVFRATRVPFVVIEIDPRYASLCHNEGIPVILGDASRPAILKHAGLDKAHGIVVAINDAKATARIVAQARTSRQDLYILADVPASADLDHLYQLGADGVLAQDFETSIEVAARVLKEMNVPDNVVSGQLQALRAGRYGMLRGMPMDRAASEELMKVLQMTATRTHYLAKDSAGCGKTIAQTELRARTGVTIIAVVRDGTPVTGPPADFRLESGDVLVLVGSHAQLEAATAYLG